MSSKRRTAKDQSITVSELKQWLSGVEDMQPADWIPNAEQWKKIRAKIAQLSEEVDEIAPATPTIQTPQYAAYQQPIYQQPIQHRAPPQTSSLGDELFIPRATPEDRALDSALPGFNAQQYD